MMVIYAATGGADFGGGIWDLLAAGPRRDRQRKLIEQAIAPIWEANHVWLIAVVVILFGGFPRAFAAISTALHVPLTLMLLGIVARGAAFTFRAYDRPEGRERWGRIFSIASAVTPLLLGVVVGSLASGGIEIRDGVVTSGFVSPWATSAFPLVCGILCVALFAHLAAVYLTVEAGADDELANDFRGRALAAGVACVALAVIVLLVAAAEAPLFVKKLLSLPIVLIATGGLSAGTLAALAVRRYRPARILAGLSVAGVIAGWGLAQAPYLVVDDLTLAGSAAPPNVVRSLLIALTVGLPPLAGCLYYLFRVFKR
jgi:cytochrome d ubiquinol oxidase subunit II